MKALIQAGGEALLLKTNQNGCSCLFIACQQGHLEVAKALIKAGGETLLFMTDGVNGATCLHSAYYCGHVTVVAHLLSLPSCAGLVGLRDRAGRTPLELAVAAGQAGAAEVMRGGAGRAGPC